MNYLADINLAPQGGFKGFGALGLEGADSSSAIGVFGKFISTTIGLLTIIGVIWFVFIFITGAISLIGSGGDKAAVESARKKITTGIIGLVVVIAVLFLIDLFGRLMGIPDILNIQAMFERLVQ